MSLDINKIKESGNLELLAKQMVEGFITGLHKSPYHGFSVEFAEHRLYNHGESTRHIDWKVFARTDKLFIKKYEEETNLRCVIILDSSSSMHYPPKGPTKLQTATLLSASIAYLLNKQRDAVGLTSFSDKIDTNTEVKSTTSHLHKIFVTLDSILKSGSKNKNTAISQTLHHIASNIHKRSLVILFTDMFDQNQDLQQIFNALQHLKHRQHEILIFHITDKHTEKDFSFSERPHRFIDMETGNEIELNPSQIKTAYKTAINDFHKEIHIRCGQAKIDLIPIDINDHDQINKTLGAYLAKRAKMK